MPESHHTLSATRPVRRARTLGLLTAFISAGVCVLLFSGVWPADADNTGLPRWAQVGLLLLALSGPLALAVMALWLQRQHLAAARAAMQQQTQQQAQRRKAVLTLLDALPVPLALCRLGDARALPNRAMCELLRLEGHAAQGPGFEWPRYLGPADVAAWQAALEAAQRSGRAQWLRCHPQLGDTPRQALMQVAPFAGEDGVELAVGLTLTEAEGGRAQEAVLQLRELLALVEGEKWHFGQAVHDELGQRLSGMAYFAKALQRKLQQAGRAEADDAGWLTDLANESMAVARGLAHGLLPVGTEDPGGLGAALAELCDRAGKTFGIDCTLSVDAGFDAGGAARASHLYHAIQELVTNAVKHGSAHKVQVRLERLEDRQRVTVRNDGASLGHTPLRLGMGLQGVRSRAAYLGAQFSFADEKPGTVLAAIDLPLAGGMLEAESTLLPDTAPPASPPGAQNEGQP